MASHGNVSSASLARLQSRAPRNHRNLRGASLPVAASSPGDLDDFRHFIASPPDGERFTLNGNRFDPADPQQWQDAEKLMGKLAFFIRNNPNPNKARPNPKLPSGYTYFLQLVAHDLVHSSLSTSLGEGQVLGLRNVRDVALRLETIYGGGPTECPHAYEANPAGFRNNLRLGASRLDSNDIKHQGPRKDIARATTSTIAELQTKHAYEDALIADPRNDSHAIISQLVVLFHELHNRIVKELAAGGGLRPTGNSFADAQRIFAAAQEACILVYRAVIRQDLLPRILHGDVLNAYESGMQPVHVPDEDEWRPPLEFTHGFFRFAHSMIRPSYRFSTSVPEPFAIEDIINRTSERSPSKVPHIKAWLIDWDLFFGANTTQGNVSIRIGPWSQVGIGNDVPGEGNLIARDLLSSVAVRPWALRHLVDRLRATSHKALIERTDFLTGSPGSNSAPWAARIGAWLKERSDATFGTANKLTDAEIKALANDPPIPFFVRFEAAHDSGNDGERLGVLGSIIVADVIYGVLQSTDGLKDQLADLSSALLGTAAGPGGNLFGFLSDLEDSNRKVTFASVRTFLGSPANGNPANPA